MATPCPDWRPPLTHQHKRCARTAEAVRTPEMDGIFAHAPGRGARRRKNTQTWFGRLGLSR
eukprot:2231956-Alexandrium_andersonii.AAC.1